MLGMTQNSTIVANRREAARETTGQFGEQTHSAPEATLLTVEEINAREDLRELGFDSATTKAREAAFYADLIDGVEKAATMYSIRSGHAGDRDDIVGDTVLDIIGQQKRGTKHINDAAFKQYSTRAVSSRYIDKNVHHTTLKARGVFNHRVEQFMQENGRMPNDVERKELADEIRLAAPAGNRPAIGFERKEVIASLDKPVDRDGDATLGDLIAASEGGSGYATATTRAAAANDALEDPTQSFRPADARKCIWNLLAEEGPSVAVKSVTDDRAHRSLVTEFGGPAAVARAWQEGETAEDAPVNDALFAPFGQPSMLDDKAREEITNVLLRHSDHAEKIWDSAMTAALDVQALRTIKRREARHAARDKGAAAA